MVRKGSPVRVRQRASSDSPATAGILFPGRSRHRSPSGSWVHFGSTWVHQPAYPLPKLTGGWSAASSDEADVHIGTPFDDLDTHAVLRPQEIAERLRVDPRS